MKFLRKLQSLWRRMQTAETEAPPYPLTWEEWSNSQPEDTRQALGLTKHPQGSAVPAKHVEQESNEEGEAPEK